MSRSAMPLVGTLFLTTAMAITAAGAQDTTIGIRFENHHFTPQTLTVPAGQPLASLYAKAAASFSLL